MLASVIISSAWLKSISMISSEKSLLIRQQREISINSHRNSKTIESFDRLPDEFVVEDVMTCFALSNMAVARVRVNRLVKDGLVERVDEFLEGGNNKAVFKKTGKVMR